MASYAANYLHRSKCWVGWTDDVPGAVTQGRTLASARENLKDAITLMLEPADVDHLPEARLICRQLGIPPV